MTGTNLKCLFVLAFLVLLFSPNEAKSQNFKVEGILRDSINEPVSGVLIRIFPDSSLYLSDEAGHFEFMIKKGSYAFQFSHVNFETHLLERFVDQSTNLEIQLKGRTQLLENVEVTDSRFSIREDQHLIKILPKDIQTMPSATGDFTKVLATLPGVSANNELSSAYSVRGGNYDENLVYVNGIKIYRPQIISAGRQEGLSFINPDMVGGINFSAGAWRASQGDVLSSVLDVEYKKPDKNEGTVNLSLLGGSLYFGGVNQQKDLSYTIGIRHKNSKYLLNTLEVKGQYFPKFTDVQTYVSKAITPRTKIGFLASAAINNYQTIPQFQQTDFGTIQASFRLNVAFEGQELMEYQTYQIGSILSHAFSERYMAKLMVSRVSSRERENYDILGGYRLCDVNNNPGSNTFNECATILGIGTNYKYGRNKLEAQILNVAQSNEIYIDDDIMEYGFNWDMESIDDQLKEYAYVDSADFVNITALRNSQTSITSHKLGGYFQYTLASKDSVDIVNAGIRFSYWTYSKQMLFSPRFQYAHRFGTRSSSDVLRLGMGIYQQHPFYRELRDRDGVINPGVRAQSSTHVVVGWDHYMNLWGRAFKMSVDGYYKYLWDVNMYDIDNVKIRYFGNNDAVGAVYGTDFRINGEFIPGIESWFSLGLLSAQEAMTYDTTYVTPEGITVETIEKRDPTRRPTDQHLNIGIFFQDHIPGDPSMKVSLNLLYGSGLPFGPPGNDAYRNAFDGDDYARVDVGFSKVFIFHATKLYMPKNLWIGLEVLNLLGAQNTISYTWIEDVQGTNYAVPNALSARFYNVRVIVKF